MRDDIKSIKILFICILFILTSFSFNVSASEESNNITFKNITTEDGLSQTTAQYIFQDSKGYMWIGTADGLNRYNGSEFKVYKYRENSCESLSSNYITAVNEDENGDIWVGTSRGLNKIDVDTNVIKNYLSEKDNCNLSDDNITEILIDSNNNILIATTNGINLYDKESDNFIRLYEDSDINNKLTSQFIYTLTEDKNKNLWVGTEEGLNKIDRSTGKITNYYSDSSKNSISDNFIYDLYVDSDNNLWIATYEDGLNKLNIETNEIERYYFDKNNINSIPSNCIRYIYKDTDNNIWIGTTKGLSKYNYSDNNFSNYKSHVYDVQSLVNDNVLCITEDDSGLVWVGTYDGISIFNRNSYFTNYKKDNLNSNSLSDNMMAGIYKDPDGLIWVGTVESGINVIDRENGIIKKYTSSKEENSLSSNNIRAITGIDNEIWIATEDGLTKYDKTLDKFTRYFNEDNKNSLISNNVRSLFIDNEGLLWITTDDGVCTFDRNDTFKSYEELFLKNGITETMFAGIEQDLNGEIWIGSSLGGGLIRINKETEEVKVYKNNEDKENSLSYNIVRCIAVDNNNTVWVGTQTGLNKFNRETETFTRYTESDGLSNNFIYGILLDDNEDLWISTNYGISKFEANNNKFINYDVTDGLQGNEFNGFSYYKAEDGEMFFGGINGLTSFYPDNLKSKNYIPRVIIERANSNNSTFFNYDEIKLKYDDNNIHFEFFLPDYRNVKKVQYAYKLEGLDEEWVVSDNRNYANYTNLDGGNYKFLVVARNSTGEWSEATEVSFKVAIKPWKSPIVYIIYVIITIIVMYVIWNRVKILDSLVEQRSNELRKKFNENEELYNKLIENEKYKNNYFINLSHELRTPLNVIISVEQLISKLNQEDKNITKDKLSYYMGTLRRNSDRLLKLINNIIDTSKIQSGSYKLDINKHNIVYLVEEVALSMKDYVESREIELIIDPEIEEKIIECDGLEIEKCIINLIANAVKFTKKGGKIEVNIIDLDDYVRISVKDTGVGIDKKYHQAIFDRFGQAYNQVSEEFGGSGLGLTLTKQLVTLHNGRIYVQSEVGEGSEFVIILPIKQNTTISEDNDHN